MTISWPAPKITEIIGKFNIQQLENLSKCNEWHYCQKESEVWTQQMSSSELHSLSCIWNSPLQRIITDIDDLQRIAQPDTWR